MSRPPFPRKLFPAVLSGLLLCALVTTAAMAKTGEGMRPQTRLLSQTQSGLDPFPAAGSRAVESRTMVTAGLYRVPFSARDLLESLRVEVDHGRIDGGFLVELNVAQARALQGAGVELRRLAASLAQADSILRRSPAFETFDTYEQIRDGLMSCAVEHPEIARLENLGLSAEGRDLLALKVSDHPEEDEDEPALAFWGGIHGNEYAGGEMPYLYALYLTDHYATDPEVRQLVDDNEIWLIPMINPDGRVHGQRTNHNGVDLNRDFGYQWNGEGGSPAPFSQIETRVVGDFCREHAITLSTTFHCSGDIVFYPWGYWPHEVPDFFAVYELAQGYAGAASYAFGNSWADYETHGELLDHLYGARGGICCTIEISNQPASLAQTFERNRLAMNWLCRRAPQGLIGSITDAESGEPLAAAVWLQDNPIPSYTEPAHGVVRRSATPGTYNLMVWANGYLPAQVAGVAVGEDSAGTFQVQLTPGGGEHAFDVISVDQKDPNRRYLQATYPSAALGAPDGAPCSLGSSGFIVLDLGAGHDVIDGSGDDFTVTEALFPADPAPEAYQVYAGDAYEQSRFIGSAVGTASFDLAASGLTSARFLKVVDASGSNPDLPYAGMDLDGITILNGIAAAVADSRVPPEETLVTAAFPQPATSFTELRFRVSRPDRLQLTLYDVRGRLISSYAPYPLPDRGLQQIRLARPQEGAGVYFYQLRSGGEEATGRLVFLE